ncbi:MAG: hypothetical protein COA84_15130 [Robiginitomaculum sp.]|nr:MAG: hypothetical protein COA84_15130 [Robiginitomaculum sp.]
MKGDKLIKNGEILLFGTIVADEWIWKGDSGYFSSLMVISALSQFEGDVTIRLNSGGGSPVEGEAIRAAIAEHPGKVTVKVTGMAYSAASLLAMGADVIEMSTGSLMMIHDPSLIAGGNEGELRHAADYLGKMAEVYASVYAARSGKTPEQAREIMKEEIFYSPADAVSEGFADKVSGEAPQAATEEMFGIAMLAMNQAFMRFSNSVGDDPQQKKTGESQLNGDASLHNKGGILMSKTKTNVGVLDRKEVDPAPKPADLPKLVDTKAIEMKAVEAYKARRDAVMLAAEPFKDTIDMAVVQTAIDSDASLTDVKLQVLQMVSAFKAPTGRGQVIGGDNDRQNVRAGMIDALSVQLGVGEADERAKQYMGMSIVDMAANLTGQTITRMGSFSQRDDILMSAAHSTSDFPLILEQAFNRVIEAAYELVDPTFHEFSREMSFTDFRNHDIIRPDNFPTLKKIGENGEIKFGTFGEKKETMALVSYATAISISRQLMVNDSLGTIAEVLNNAAGVVPEFEEETFYAMMLSNPDLSDSVALFHADHGNLGASGAITTTTVAAGRKAMRTQKQADGRSVKMNAPSILIVGPERETEAEEFLSTIIANATADVNVFAGKLRLVVTEAIEDTKWYLSVDKAKKTHVMKHGYLEGRRAPRIRLDEPFGRQGTAMSIEHDFAAGAVGYMGMYRRG